MRCISRRLGHTARTVVFTSLLVGTALEAQHPAGEHGKPQTSDSTKTMSMADNMTGPLGLPMSRRGSGTAWLPDAAPMYARQFMAGAWTLMAHGEFVVQYNKQGFSSPNPRGDSQFGSINWVMLMASRNIANGQLTLRGMMSLEAWTLGGRGYPLFLQTGESFEGEPLVDRQHPHDLFMELAALYERAIASNVGVSLYVAPVGEPASGPVAFMHRPSGMSDPFSPIGHHWQDATHITFGVITAGVFTRTIKLEGSIFNGREPDENRTNFDYRGRSLDSYAGRLTVNPSANWSLEGSYAYLKSPEELHPDESLHRITAAALYDRPWRATGQWSSALIYGANRHGGDGRMSTSVLLESNMMLNEKNTIFGRAEVVQKSAEELVLDDDIPSDRQFTVGALALGYVRQVGTFSGLITGGTIGLGVRGALNMVPASLRDTYGTRTPIGIAVFLRLSPPRMMMDHMNGPMKDTVKGTMNMPHHM